MTNYRSLVGGFYSNDPYNKTIPTSIRCNNAGAINGAAYERNFPGYVTEVETTAGNKTTIFETPEQGVACYWELLRRYRSAGAVTVKDIIWKYGGGQANYTTYADWVANHSGLALTQEIRLDDDAQLLKFGKAMFQYEAGQKIPWSDGQILYGFKLGRQYAGGKPASAAKSGQHPAASAGAASILVALMAAIVTFTEVTMEYVAVFLAGYILSIFTWGLAKEQIGKLIDKIRPLPPAPPPAPKV